jgi:hypothetical protein
LPDSTSTKRKLSSDLRSSLDAVPQRTFTDGQELICRTDLHLAVLLCNEAAT